MLERMIYNKITLSGTRTQVHAPATNGDQVAPRQRAVAAHGGATPMAGQMQAEVRGTPVAFKPCESLSMDGLGYRCNRPRPGLPSAGGLRWALAGLAGLPGPPRHGELREAKAAVRSRGRLWLWLRRHFCSEARAVHAR